MRTALLLAAFLIVTPCFAAQPNLVIHEWGTFTSLQDEDGNAIGGINGDEETLPPFVHDLIRNAQTDATRLSKGGVPRCFPSVTMRLETPVLYFHPAAGATFSSVDVSAEFRGGLLTQFYPDAIASTPPMKGAMLQTITGDTDGKLAWSCLNVGVEQNGPQTDAHVWTAPREAAAANVRGKSGEAERFLFYRGVGHLDAPVRAVRHGSSIELHSQIAMPIKDLPDLSIGGAWFCRFRPDGRCAWRAAGPLELSLDSGKTMATLNSFDEGDFSADNLANLKKSMHASLVAAGLFDDEATAMLDTWELSYFKSAGTRLFFIVPRAWSDHYLPLRVSVDADINRVMVGRIDVVTPEHREALRQLATIDPKTDPAKFTSLYQQLGRFRDALLLESQRRHPDAAGEKMLAAVGIDAKAN
jgi:hypothetical protein